MITLPRFLVVRLLPNHLIYVIIILADIAECGFLLEFCHIDIGMRMSRATHVVSMWCLDNGNGAMAN